jgi:hypothetical protein
MRGAGLALLALLAVAPAVAASRGEDPDWPCPQRLVPSIAAGSLWSGPELPDPAPWREAPEVAALVARAAPRSVDEATGLRTIETFAAPLDAAGRRRLLPLAFAGLLEETNRQRAELIGHIKVFARRQRGVAETVNRITAELDAVPPETSGEAAARRAELEQRHFFASKAFQDAERTLRYVCEAPVRLEARLGAYARALEAALPGN